MLEQLALVGIEPGTRPTSLLPICLELRYPIVTLLNIAPMTHEQINFYVQAGLVIRIKNYRNGTL